MLVSAQQFSDEGDHASAALVLGNLLARTKDRELQQDLHYKKAKQLFLSHDWPAASRALENFAISYKDDSRNGEARYMLLFAQYQTVKRIAVECDAGETERLARSAKALLVAESVTNRRNDITAILHDCQDRLLSKAVSTFEFYLRRGDLKSARGRLDKIKQDFGSAGLEPSVLEPRIMYLECKLAKAQDNFVEAQSIANLIAEKFPDSKFLRMAETHLNAGKFWAKFGIPLKNA